MKFSTLCLIATTAFADNIPVGESGVPDKTKTYISGITYGGSGCKQGTVSSSISQDLTTFTLIFDTFIAETGPGKSISDSRKNCQINVDLRYPQGWSYSIVSVDYRGFVSLPKGTTAEQTSTYYFSGETAQVKASSTFRGPFENNYLISDQIETSEIVWSPCGKVIQGNVNAAVNISGDRSKSALITVDSIDGKVKQIYGVQWRQC
jgi:hypothetical protein